MFKTREEWLAAAVKEILVLVSAYGYTPTAEIRIAPGFPKSKKAIGECWHSTCSEAGFREIFISPVLEDELEVAGTVAHELGHACLPENVGHKRPFIKYCKTIGFDFEKAEYASSGEEFARLMQPILARLGKYPHSRMRTGSLAGGKKKQGTRMLLIECPVCGAKLRTTKKVLAAISGGVARCIDPDCPGEMEINLEDEGDED